MRCDWDWDSFTIRLGLGIVCDSNGIRFGIGILNRILIGIAIQTGIQITIRILIEIAIGIGIEISTGCPRNTLYMLGVERNRVSLISEVTQFSVKI